VPSVTKKPNTETQVKSLAQNRSGKSDTSAQGQQLRKGLSPEVRNLLTSQHGVIRVTALAARTKKQKTVR